MLNRWNFQQESPWQNLQRYAGIATGIGGMGGSGTSTQKTEQSFLSQLTGLLAGGAGAYKAFGG
jgi:hypothetical protein